MNKEKAYKSIFLFNEEYNRINDDYKKMCEKEAIRIISTNNKGSNNQHSITVNNSSERNILSKLKNNIIQFSKEKILLRDVYNFSSTSINILSYYLKLIKKINSYKEILNKSKPSLIILPEENTIYGSSIITKIARNLSIPSVIIPYTIANETEFAEIFYYSNEVKSYMDRVVTHFFPQWLYIYKKRRLILLAYWQILILEILKLASPRPWFVNSGFNNLIAVESPHMMKYYLDNGLEPRKLLLTGSISDDMLYNLNKASLRLKLILKKKLHLDNKPIILCMLTPSLPEKIPSDYSDYAHFIELLIDSLSKLKKYNVIYNLHPNIDRKILGYLYNYKIKIVRNDIVELIPLCDLYIASASATIRWAIACGIPVINYDLYKYNYNDYDNINGVITIENKRDFLNELKKINENKSYISTIRNKQKLYVKEWGMMDGKSGERVLNTLNRLIEQKTKTA
ncbi:MAG: hypothetical protein WCT77_03965 [Bacteroidota bacterium]